MPSVYIEALPIKVKNLGFFGFDHLQLVYVPDSLTSIPVPQEEWYVIEGTVVTGTTGDVLGVLGDSGSLALWLANGGVRGAALEAEIGTPDVRGGRLLTATNADVDWNRMAAHATEIHDTQFVYTSFRPAFYPIATLNSTSFIASVLFSSGYDITQNFPYRVGRSPGYTTLLGTIGDDNMSIQMKFNALFGGWGNDQFTGGSAQGVIDRMYGGGDDDVITWSPGVDFAHGGDNSMTYDEDGRDTLDFVGAGQVLIEREARATPHLVPDFKASHDQGTTWLFSIERVRWGNENDSILLGEGVELLDVQISIDLGDEDPDGNGDELSFEQATGGLIINAGNDTGHFVQPTSASGNGGIWLESVEWLTGSSYADRIYAGTELRGIEGGAGDDHIDARLVTAHSGQSPLGYDIEINGGDGDDTIIGGVGRSHVIGGDGSDRFVLSSLTTGPQAVEFVIADADSQDSLYVPYAFLDGSIGSFDGSQLMPILGAIGTFDEMQDEGWTLFYEHRTLSQIHDGNDQTEGVIDFVAYISFVLDGSDLVITVERGEAVQEDIVSEDDGTTRSYIFISGLSETDAVIRVLDFQEGDLGLNFIDPGEQDSESNFPNWDSAVDQLNETMLPAFDLRPIAPSSDPNAPGNAPPRQVPVNGGNGDDLISLDQPADVDAGAGNDTIVATGNGSDSIDGGAGDDHMAGGGGNDEYAVDSAGDTVIEEIGAGSDTVVASVDYTLPDFVEHLTLGGSAVTATGNSLANRLVGNGGDNILIGLDGGDTLAGLGGDDTLIGGEGSDGYIYFQGDGHDVIVDTGTGSGDIDELLLFDQLRPADITATRMASALDDLILSFTGGGRVTIAGFYTAADAGIDEIRFDDGTVMTRAEVDTLAAGAAIVSNTAPDAASDFELYYGGVDFIVPAELLLANDRDDEGDPLDIVAVSGFSSGSGSIDANGDVQLSLTPGFDGDLTFNYTISDGNGGTATAAVSMTIVPNSAPTVTAAIADQQATVGQAFALTVPVTHYDDADNDLLSVTATLADGSPLPAWLNFDWLTDTLHGTPPGGTAGTLTILLTATDGFLPVTETFTLTIAPAAGSVIDGNADNNIIIGGGGHDILRGHGGNDTFSGNAGADYIDGAAGVDRVSYYGQTADLVIRLDNASSHGGNAEGDLLIGMENVTGGFGHDTIMGNTDDNLLDAQDGNDTLYGFGGSDHLRGGGGNDTLYGGTGSDILQGGDGDDRLHGGDGNDVFDGGSGADHMDGGAGVDRVSYYGQTADLVIRLDNASSHGGTAEGDLLIGMENVTGGFGNDTIMGNADDNLLDAQDGNDTLNGFGGSDHLRGGGGNDALYGGTGNDILQGGDGDDHLVGGDGNDLFNGGAGADQFDGGAGVDRASYYDQTVSLTIHLDGTTSHGGHAEGDVLVAIEWLTAGAGNDTIYDSADDNFIDGYGGDDTIHSSLGNDLLRGGAGADTFVFAAGFGRDTILDMDFAAGGDSIDLSSAAFADFADLLAHASENGTDTIITIDATNSLTLLDVAVAQLAADHFLLA